MYAIEQRRIPGEKDPVTCVVLDTVQSQANRMEEALQTAFDDGVLAMPMAFVDFSDSKLPDSVGRISALQTPHRIVDAIFRDSELDKIPFRESKIGKNISLATSAFATPLLRLCPTALIFGMWDSAGPKGGLGTKFERAIVSEVIGVNAEVGIKATSRIDPVITTTSSIVLYKKGLSYTLDPTEADKDEKKKPILYGKKEKAGKVSAANLGNVTPSTIDNKTKKPLHGGVTVDYVEQTITLSLIQLRRLRFPAENSTVSDLSANVAARVFLASLAIASAALAFEAGMDLRSRCIIFPEEAMTWDLLSGSGASSGKRFEIDGPSALKLVSRCLEGLIEAKLPLQTIRAEAGAAPLKQANFPLPDLGSVPSAPKPARPH